MQRHSRVIHFLWSCGQIMLLLLPLAGNGGEVQQTSKTKAGSPAAEKQKDTPQGGVRHQAEPVIGGQLHPPHDSPPVTGGVSISDVAGASADASAILDVNVTGNPKKGILIPRMTQAERTAVTSPATGLLVYQTDGAAGFYFFNGSAWTQLGSGGGGAYLPLGGGVMSGAITNTGNPPITMGKGSFGAGNTNAGAQAFVAGSNNNARGNYSVVAGGGGSTLADSNSALGDYSTVSGGFSNRAYGIEAATGGGGLNAAQSDYSFIGGGNGNTTTGQSATIGGGGSNSSSGQYGVIGGGNANTVTGSNATVGGGGQNRARGNYSVVAGGGGSTPGDSNSVSGNYSSIGGGRGNTIHSDYATISGGQANSAEGWGSIGGGGSNIAGSYATVGGGLNDSATAAGAVVGGGSANTASGLTSAIGGGQNNKALGYYAMIGGGGGNTTSGSFSSIGGGSLNTVGNTYAVIGGGNTNVSMGEGTTVSGGGFNAARGSYAVISGGGGPTPSDSNSASGDYSMIGGGEMNIVSGPYSSIGGGYHDSATADYSVVSGGTYNSVTESFSTVGGGEENAARGAYSTVAGGQENGAMDFYGTVGGGGGNTAVGREATIAGGYENTATGRSGAISGGYTNGVTGPYGAVGGGEANYVSGEWGAIGGGSTDSATGTAATIPGGLSNLAGGAYSFAAGHRAKARHDGSFVWTDATNADFSSTGANQFLIRASGNVGINTNAPQAALHLSVSGGDAYQGLGITSTLTGGKTLTINQGTPGKLNFTNPGITDLMTVDFVNQRVGIGTTTPDQLLSVNGFASKPGGGTWATYSDLRLKTDIHAFDDGLGAVRRINPVTFRYNGRMGLPTGKEYVGVIAQQIRPVAPYTVDTFRAKLDPGDADSTDVLRFDANALTFVLINAVKELDKRVSEIETLKAENTVLLDRLACLEATVRTLRSNTPKSESTSVSESR